MIKITQNIILNDNEIELFAIRAQGAGGQNVNKVSTAVHLRFNIHTSSLPELYKKRLLNLNDYRITQAGIVNIKAQRYRTQAQNKMDAIERLQALIERVLYIEKVRKPKRITQVAKQKRLAEKGKRSQLKAFRSKPIQKDE